MQHFMKTKELSKTKTEKVLSTAVATTMHILPNHRAGVARKQLLDSQDSVDYVENADLSIPSPFTYLEECDHILSEAHREFEQALSQYSFYKVNNRTLSEDLVQDTFMKTWKYLVKGGKIEVMKAFLYHVLNDLITDEYRKRKTVSLDALLENGFDRNDGEFERLFSILDGRVAMTLIAELPKKYQQVMHMRYVDDLSLEEISQKTAQSKNSVAVQLHRGLEKLKVLYQDASDATLPARKDMTSLRIGKGI